MNFDLTPWREEKQEDSVRGTWLVRTSTLLAIGLGVIPVERDAVRILVGEGAILLAVAVVLICVTLVLLPFVIYVARNGAKALKYVRVHVAGIGLIVVFNLAHNILMLLVSARQFGVL